MNFSRQQTWKLTRGLKIPEIITSETEKGKNSSTALCSTISKSWPRSQPYESWLQVAKGHIHSTLRLLLPFRGRDHSHMLYPLGRISPFQDYPKILISHPTVLFPYQVPSVCKMDFCRAWCCKTTATTLKQTFIASKLTDINRGFHKVVPAAEVLAQTVFNILNEQGLMGSPLPARLGKLCKPVWVETYRYPAGWTVSLAEAISAYFISDLDRCLTDLCKVGWSQTQV